jgi:hypothetical protein
MPQKASEAPSLDRIAHDVRNMIDVLRHNVAFLRHGQVAGEGREALDDMEWAANRIHELTEVVFRRPPPAPPAAPPVFTDEEGT